MNDETPPLIAHCESHLGPIVSGFSDDQGRRPPFQVALFERSGIAGASVLCTLGLSDIPLRVGDGPKRLRQELVAMFRTADGPRNLPAILVDMGLEAIERNRAYAVGDVIGPRGELQHGSTLSALYVALPVYLPDSFQVCRTPEPIVFAWFVPITVTEAQFARARGRDAFESALESADPDLLDHARDGIV